MGIKQQIGKEETGFACEARDRRTKPSQSSSHMSFLLRRGIQKGIKLRRRILERGPSRHDD